MVFFRVPLLFSVLTPSYVIAPLNFRIKLLFLLIYIIHPRLPYFVVIISSLQLYLLKLYFYLSVCSLTIPKSLYRTSILLFTTSSALTLMYQSCSAAYTIKSKPNHKINIFYLVCNTQAFFFSYYNNVHREAQS